MNNDNAFKSLCDKAINVLQRHAPPDGLSDHAALSELYSIFDGPEQRAAYAAPVAGVPDDYKAAGNVMLSAYNLCPTELSQLVRMRWIAEYFLTNYVAPAVTSGVPDGYVLFPVIPTDKMLEGLRRSRGYSPETIYRDLLDDVPTLKESK
jgi:hypothetical protein